MTRYLMILVLLVMIGSILSIVFIEPFSGGGDTPPKQIEQSAPK